MQPLAHANNAQVHKSEDTASSSPVLPRHSRELIKVKPHIMVLEKEVQNTVLVERVTAASGLRGQRLEMAQTPGFPKNVTLTTQQRKDRKDVSES